MSRIYPLITSLIFIISACVPAVSTPLPTETATNISPYPRTILGTITENSDRVLVEQQPGATIGDKILFNISDETQIYQRVNSDLDAKTFDYLAVGQRVEVWAGGAIVDTWPGQAQAVTIVILDSDEESTTESSNLMLPDRPPDVSGTITQAVSTVWIDQKVLLFITPTTLFLRRSGNTVETIDAREIKEGQRVDVWVEQTASALQPKDHPQANAQVIVVVDD